ncbi:MAG TPA: ATP-binding cassette domain-containing protein [Rhodanobacter sp.]|jgi:ATP-binding cassette subfamily B protein RaxB|nr:ATP-binding cassette domain-containing protein [Rhodanobacter sp.]
MSGKLFRQQVMEAQRSDWLDSIMVAAPLSRWLLTVLVLALAAAIALFLLLGHYTRRATVRGLLVPTAGLLNVVAPSVGTITRLAVRDSQHVTAGDVWLRLSSEQDSAALGDVHTLVGKEFETQRARLQADLQTQWQSSAVITAARSWAVMWLGATLNVQWASNLFSHLMRLPLDWFGKRHVGDVVSRFGSIQTIQRTLTTQFIGSLLDGLMSLVTLAVMALYSVWLTALIVGLFLVYGLIRWAFFNPLRRANEEQIVYAARQESELLESIRGAMPIKLANKQDERLGRYANATVATANRNIGIQRLGIGFTLSNQLMFGIGRVAMIWIAATLALEGRFSAGMLIAFIAYADQFTSRAASLIDKWVDFSMLKLHAERVADIALSAPETLATPVWSGPIPDASIELHDVSFRYADSEPWILRHCNLRVEAGESVAIVGPSGCGKSTLAKVALGLLTPQEGEVRFGGIDIRKLGLDTYRQWIGAVMQDDQLFAGSIADNISFFDPTTNSMQIEAAARLACIHDDIMAMPMSYQSLVGDMGSSLSGGQKQRVILARAMYRQPKLLVLDEATSHLDMHCEQEVGANVGALSVTRLVIAHRTHTVAAAQQVLVVTAGKTHPISSPPCEVEVAR